MASKSEDTVIDDEFADSSSDVSVEFDVGKRTEEIKSSKEQSESESSDDCKAHTRRIRRLLSLPSDPEESDEDCSLESSDVDLPNTSNDEFEGSPSPNVFPKDIQNVENAVELFIGDDFFELICTETNRYYNQNASKRKPNKKTAKFEELTVVELKKWFGLCTLMGIVKKTKIDDYWLTNPLLETPIFRKTMSRNRFREILLFLHFSDDNNKPENADRLFKVQPIINYFSKKFQEITNLSKNNIKMIRISSTICNTNLVGIKKKSKKDNYTIKTSVNTLDSNKDMADQLFSYYPIYGETIKWSKKVMFYLFNCALYDAYKLHQHYNNAECKILRFFDFLLKICEFWISDHLPATEEKSEVSTASRDSNYHSIHRLSGKLKQHQLVLISTTDKRKRRRCHVCYKNKIMKTTNLMCKFCGVALHLGECFASYHLKEKY